MKLVNALSLERFRMGDELAGPRRRRRPRREPRRDPRMASAQAVSGDSLKEKRAANKGKLLDLASRLPIESLFEQDDSADGFGAGTRGWGPVASMGNLRIQAPIGVRAAVIELKPGLFLVAEVPEAVVQQDAVSGVYVMLAKKITSAAKDVLSKTKHHPQELPAAQPAQLPGPVANQLEGDLTEGFRARRERYELGCRCRWEES